MLRHVFAEPRSARRWGGGAYRATRRRCPRQQPEIALLCSKDNVKVCALQLSELTAICPLDGRYGAKVADLRECFSEYALIAKRVLVECRWLHTLSSLESVPEVPELTVDAASFLEELSTSCIPEITQEVKDIELTTNHDVKAVEYALKRRMASNEQLKGILEFTHFGCTSEDINNLSHALMLKQARDEHLLPAMDGLVFNLCDMVDKYADVPMLSRTHGQTASPTTLGREIGIFAYRLARQRSQVADVPLLGKMAGAVGNYNAHFAAYPDVVWDVVAKDFVEGLGLQWNPHVTQIESHDYIAELFGAVMRFNNVLLDFDRDMWLYVSLGYFKQRAVKGEVGSSTMPHKVNPIDFENSEGNLGLANAIMDHLATKLPISRWQRDLSDSTVLRNIGLGIGYSILAYSSSQRGVCRVDLDAERLAQDLDSSWEVLAEPIQTMMRKHGVTEPYEKLKSFARGKAVTAESVEAFIKGLDLPETAKIQMLGWTPRSYLGNAIAQARGMREVCMALIGHQSHS